MCFKEDEEKKRYAKLLAISISGQPNKAFH